MKKETTIKLSQEFHDWLEKKGRKNETYEDIIKRNFRVDIIKDKK